MQYTVLGKTGVKVSKLCFGTMSFGGDADEDTSKKMFNCCREKGINFFDCANVYSKGRAEEILGKFIRGSRHEVVITSKVGMTMNDGRIQPGLSRRSIMRSVEDSLRRLNTDWIDVYFCHLSDPNTPIDEILRALDDLVKQGKILYAGVSNWPAWKISRAAGRAEVLGCSGIHVIQPMYNLVKRTAEIEILPFAESEKIGVITYSPLGGGLLTGKYSTINKDEKGRLSVLKTYINRYADVKNYEIAEKLCAYAADRGIHPATLAVAWVKAHPAVTAPIIGARNLEQLECSLTAADYEMSHEEWKEISSFTDPVPLATDRDEERK